MDFLSRLADRNNLFLQTHQVASHLSGKRFVAAVEIELIQLKITTQLPVDARKQVQIEIPGVVARG